jgi:hypothetical protein
MQVRMMNETLLEGSKFFDKTPRVFMPSLRRRPSQLVVARQKCDWAAACLRSQRGGMSELRWLEEVRWRAAARLLQPMTSEQLTPA